MDKLVVHPQTQQQLEQFAAHPSHAILLVGATGIGKTALAEGLAKMILELEDLTSHPYFKMVSPEKDSIPIDAVRELQHFLQLKTLGQRKVRRVITLEHAEGLTTEAQNAFLKLLEEPPADTLMILTVDNQRALLPTILSRTQVISVTPPVESDIRAFFSTQGKDGTAINQAYFLSGGLPGLMHALLGDDEKHPLLPAVTQAKVILQQPVFERLAMVEALSKQKAETRYVVEALAHISQTGIAQATNRGDTAKLKQWHHVLSEATRAQKALSQNASAKLVLDNLMLQL